MRTALFVLVVLAAPAFAAQTVWKWVDEHGVTHYSDRPVPGATKMEIASGNRAETPAPPAVTTSSPEQQTLSGPPYRNFEIWKPAAGESIVNTGGQVTVNVRVDPNLQAGHGLYLYLDGRLVEGFPPNAASYELKDVPRGAHRAVAVITDRRGERIQESDPVVFYVRQTSIANPPVGPVLRPKPKPRTGAANKLPRRQPSYATLNGERSAIDPATNAPLRQPSTAKP